MEPPVTSKAEGDTLHQFVLQDLHIHLTELMEIGKPTDIEYLAIWVHMMTGNCKPTLIGTLTALVIAKV